MHLLETSKGLDPFFVEIEKARTQAHVVNSYLNYFMFTQGYVACDMGNEGSTPQGKEYIESIREYVEPLVKSFLDDRFSLNADIRWAVEVVVGAVVEVDVEAVVEVAEAVVIVKC